MPSKAKWFSCDPLTIGNTIDADHKLDLHAYFIEILCLFNIMFVLILKTDGDNALKIYIF